MAYTILKEIGRGGMGCVYKGQAPDGTMVALKMMSNKMTCYPEIRDLFYSEVDTLKSMNHPLVVHIVGEPYSDDKGNLYLPMEFVEGETLEHHINQYGPLKLSDAMSLMSKILEAMQYVHNRNRIHRDIKPSNIMLRPDGRICVIDFGIAKDAHIGGTGKTVGRVIGTDGYMSPEQANGLNIDHRTDIYSLGCLFFFMLTGRHAVKKETNDYETVANILNGTMPRPSQFVPGIPESVDNAFLRAVDKNMLRRFQTASEFKEALEAAVGQPVPKITVGKLPDNDICINSEYVSRRHLVIRGLELPQTGGSVRYAIEITDNSTNGTGVDGRPLRHNSMIIDYNGTVNLPEVLLAARSECPLNWGEVISKLKGRGWLPSPFAQNSSNSSTSPGGSLDVIDNSQKVPPVPSQDESLNPLLCILCLLAPVVGFVLWGVWRDEHPKKSSQAAAWAWGGVGLNVIFFILSQL